MASAYSQQSSNITKTYLLIFIFIGLFSAICYLFAYSFNNISIAIAGLIVSIFQSISAYYFGDKIALSVAGAKEVSPEDAPKIHNLVENLSKIAGIPKPRVFISPDKSANAFACGRDPQHASICLNEGIIQLLDKNELEGVIAHELSHIRNRDILIMTVTMVLASTIAFVSDWGTRILFWGGGKDSNENRSPISLIIFIAVLVISPFISLLIQLAVSRRREYLADASAVTLTRYPEGLMNALQKLYSSPVPSQHYSSATNHFYIAPPKLRWGDKINSLLSTHPSIEDRISALKQM